PADAARSAGQTEPPRAAAYVRHPHDEWRRRPAGDTGTVGTRLSEHHAGLYAQQHCEAEGGVRRGASAGPGPVTAAGGGAVWDKWRRTGALKYGRISYERTDSGS